MNMALKAETYFTDEEVEEPTLRLLSQTTQLYSIKEAEDG
jgi:hypothetical protein